MRNRVVGQAHARVGLLGNPSDAYGGKAIAFSLGNFAARAWVEAAEGWEIEAPDGEVARWASFAELVAPIAEGEGRDGERLLRAALRRFVARFPSTDMSAGLRMGYETDIPREVGLSGSSAIAIACLQALLGWCGERLSNDELAELALAAEVEELGIAAGPMDRLIQTHEGCMWMDFGAHEHRQVDLALLPEMFVAWDPRGGEASSIVHSDVRKRYERGDADVREAMAVFPQLVDDGMTRLERGDHAGFAELVDRNFDTRAAIWKLSETNRELVAIGRGCGCGVKQTGSGGAVVGVMGETTKFADLVKAYEAAGYRVVRPEFVAAGTSSRSSEEAKA